MELNEEKKGDIYGAEDYKDCPECRIDGRRTLTLYPVCQRCQNEHSPHRDKLPHWDANGNPVN